ncbi:unnamed protein product [Nezara viridula]|uniref:Uncharacterized protein n=1 Tax=Nezara viridula TaxID=85310 RepID=A0A9P0E307_NEZVI|nr:unnamed protein product [Nezara viridula]
MTSCPTVSFNNTSLIPVEQIRYLGLYLEKRLTWNFLTRLKRQETSRRFRLFQHLLDKRSKLSINYKSLIYMIIIRTYLDFLCYGAPLTYQIPLVSILTVQNPSLNPQCSLIYEVKGITLKQAPSSPEGKMTEEGQMNSEGMKGLVREIPDIKEGELKKLEQVADKCGEASLGEDRCENAVTIYDCINTVADEIHLEPPYQTETTRNRPTFSITAALIDKRTKLPTIYKRLTYITIIRSIWTYGIELWGSTKPSNSSRIQSLQSKILRKILNAPFYVTNDIIHKDLNVPYVSDLAQSRYPSFHNKLLNHPKPLISNLASSSIPDNPPRSLKRRWPRDLLM